MWYYVIKSKLLLIFCGEISLAKNLLTIVLVFWCIDKLLRYLLRSTCYTKMTCKTYFSHTWKWQDMIQTWWDCLVMSPPAWYPVPLLSMNCLFKWQSDSLYLISFIVDQSSPSADLLNKNDGWMVILELGKISNKISYFIATLMFGFFLWVFIILLFKQISTDLVTHKDWVTVGSADLRISHLDHKGHCQHT